MRKLWGADIRTIARIQHGTRPHTVFIVVHDMEADDIDGVERFFARSSPDEVGAHLGIAGGTIRKPKVRQWADLDALVYHAKGANSESIGIELCGFASYPRRKWITRRGQRIALAETLARLCHAYDLGEPQRHHNVKGHVDIPAGGHTDPGPNFPWDLVMKLARKRYRQYYPKK